MADGNGPFEHIRWERRGQIGLLTLNAPDRLNALSAAMRAEIETVVAQALDDDGVRAVVLTGAGRGFCSGADLQAGAAVMAATPIEPRSQSERIDDMGWVGRWATMWARFDKPLVGAINGVAAGAGLSTALACDVRIGSENARFKSVFIERNLSPDSGLSFYLPRVIGYAAAADMIFTSRAVGAEEALRIGLINRLEPADTLVDAAVAYAEEMAQWPPLALRMSKRVLQRNQDAELEDALRYESVGLQFSRRAVNDVKESQAAFREKRKGVYTGS
ncbi:MAG: enoyl-CoA hydratase-related protein [Phenylobacterium sp.]|nr:enoyl-CoA hydratase-related protein [Phenylobacterium sp.]